MSRSTLPTVTRRVMPALAGALILLGVVPAYAQAAFRDISVTLTNASDQGLELARTHLPAGCWASGSPPSSVPIGSTVTIHSESCGVLTGTEFTLDYRLQRSGQNLRLHYNNPAAGSDEFDELVPSGYARSGGGTIENRSMTFSCDSRVCDGIADPWKTGGVTIDPAGPAGPQFVDLPRMGVESDRPTVFVQLDWMKDATHDTSFDQPAIDRVIRAYDQAPRTYPGATRPGINLVVDHGPDSTIEPNGAKWGSLSRAGAIPWAEGLLTGWRDTSYDLTNLYDLVRTRLGPTGRLPLFHYAITPDYIVPSRTKADGTVEFDSTSGYGVSWGFITSLGGWSSGNPTQDEQTGTFMHELGHTLGLRHGGEDDDQYKPNYPSVMNYLFQTKGIPHSDGSSAWDYSQGASALFETIVTETGGFPLLPAGFGTGHRCPNGKDAAGKTVYRSVLITVQNPIDWACDGPPDTSTHGHDVNGDGTQTILAGSSSDWDRIWFKSGGIGGGLNPEASLPGSGATAGAADELTAEEDATIAPIDTTAPSTTLGRSPAPNAAGWNRTSVTLTLSASDGAGSGVVRTEAAIDGGAHNAVTVPVVVSAEGVHTIRYRSIDFAQNVEQEDTATVRIDRTDPVSSVALDPALNADGWQRNTVTLTVSATDTGGSGVVRSEAAVDGAGYSTVSGPVVVSAEGIHTVRYRSIDLADNVEQERTTTVRIDRTAPLTTGTLEPQPNAAGWNHGPVSVRVAATDALSGVRTTTVSSEGTVTTAPATTPGASATLLVDSDGTTTVRHHATDRADNSGADVLTTVRTDATPPSATIKAATQGLTITNRVTGTARDATSGVASVAVTYTPTIGLLGLLGSSQTVQAQLTCEAGRLSCTWVAPRPSQLGLWKVTAVTQDIAGNVDPVPPSAEITIVL